MADLFVRHTVAEVSSILMDHETDLQTSMKSMRQYIRKNISSIQSLLTNAETVRQCCSLRYPAISLDWRPVQDGVLATPEDLALLKSLVPQAIAVLLADSDPQSALYAVSLARMSGSISPSDRERCQAGLAQLAANTDQLGVVYYALYLTLLPADEDVPTDPGSAFFLRHITRTIRVMVLALLEARATAHLSQIECLLHDVEELTDHAQIDAAHKVLATPAPPSAADAPLLSRLRFCASVGPLDLVPLTPSDARLIHRLLMPQPTSRLAVHAVSPETSSFRFQDLFVADDVSTWVDECRTVVARALHATSPRDIRTMLTEPREWASTGALELWRSVLEPVLSAQLQKSSLDRLRAIDLDALSRGTTPAPHRALVFLSPTVQDALNAAAVDTQAMVTGWTSAIEAAAESGVVGAVVETVAQSFIRLSSEAAAIAHPAPLVARLAAMVAIEVAHLPRATQTYIHPIVTRLAQLVVGPLVRTYIARIGAMTSTVDPPDLSPPLRATLDVSSDWLDGLLLLTPRADPRILVAIRSAFIGGMYDLLVAGLDAHFGSLFSSSANVRLIQVGVDLSFLHTIANRPTVTPKVPGADAALFRRLQAGFGDHVLWWTRVGVGVKGDALQKTWAVVDGRVAAVELRYMSLVAGVPLRVRSG